MRNILCLVDPIIKLTVPQIERLSKKFHLVSGFQVPAENLSKVQGILLHSKISESTIQQFPHLQWIGVRAKNLAYVPEDTRLRLTVFGIESLAEIPVTEQVFSLMLAVMKKTLLNYKLVMQGNWDKARTPSQELYGKTLGIIGYGTIGQRIAKISEAFGMNILIANSDRHKEYVPVEEVLARSDIITLNMSSSPSNFHFMNLTRLKLMKKGAVLINTARGDMIDEQALIEVLNEGHLKGAGLDVLEHEPPQGVSLQLIQHPLVVVSPHIGFVTVETMAKMTAALVEAVDRVVGLS